MNVRNGRKWQIDHSSEIETITPPPSPTLSSSSHGSGSGIGIGTSKVGARVKEWEEKTTNQPASLHGSLGTLQGPISGFATISGAKSSSWNNLTNITGAAALRGSTDGAGPRIGDQGLRIGEQGSRNTLSEGKSFEPKATDFKPFEPAKPSNGTISAGSGGFLTVNPTNTNSSPVGSSFIGTLPTAMRPGAGIPNPSPSTSGTSSLNSSTDGTHSNQGSGSYNQTWNGFPSASSLSGLLAQDDVVDASPIFVKQGLVRALKGTPSFHNSSNLIVSAELLRIARELLPHAHTFTNLLLNTVGAIVCNSIKMKGRYEHRKEENKSVEARPRKRQYLC